MNRSYISEYKPIYYRSRAVLVLTVVLVLVGLAFGCKKTSKPEEYVVDSPVFSPGGGTYDSLTIVTISCATEGALIRFTMDGSEPQSYSTIYRDPLPISRSEIVKARAFKEGWTTSPVITASFVINPYQVVATPVFSPEAGNWDSVIVSLSCATPGAQIRFTTDGSEPSSSSSIYTGSITVNESTTLKAKGFKLGWIPSATASAHYHINIYPVAKPAIYPPGGVYSSVQRVTLECATEGASLRYTTNGSEPTLASAVYNNPIYIASNLRLKVKGFKEGWEPSPTATALYQINLSPTQMVYIPGGNFNMGDTHGAGSAWELPVHSVTLSPFYLGKYEVTQAQWEQVMGPNPAYGRQDRDEYPAYNANSYAAMVYCNLLSMSEGLEPCYFLWYGNEPVTSANPADWGPIPTLYNYRWSEFMHCIWTNNGYRLPTEAEWEYAARGGTNQPDYWYSGSNNLNEVAWHMGNTNGGPKPVGSKLANGLGIYDMSGNVWEWVWDHTSSNYYSISPQVNPTGPDDGVGTRIVRGGAWEYGASECRVSCRGDTYPHLIDKAVGFRVCRSAW